LPAHATIKVDLAERLGYRRLVEPRRAGDRPRRYVVLSDHERDRLREVERQLLAEDPEFTRSFATCARRLRRRRLGASVKIAVMAALLLGGLMLMAGSPAGALGFAATVGLIWLAWWHSNNPSRPVR
jgi:hypothetical protein